MKIRKYTDRMNRNVKIKVSEKTWMPVKSTIKYIVEDEYGLEVRSFLRLKEAKAYIASLEK